MAKAKPPTPLQNGPAGEIERLAELFRLARIDPPDETAISDQLNFCGFSRGALPVLICLADTHRELTAFIKKHATAEADGKRMRAQLNAIARVRPAGLVEAKTQADEIEQLKKDAYQSECRASEAKNAESQLGFLCSYSPELFGTPIGGDGLADGLVPGGMCPKVHNLLNEMGLKSWIINSWATSDLPKPQKRRQRLIGVK